jgi:hypothetical protein
VVTWHHDLDVQQIINEEGRAVPVADCPGTGFDCSLSDGCSEQQAFSRMPVAEVLGLIFGLIDAVAVEPSVWCVTFVPL